MNDAFNGSGLKYVTVYWGGEWTDPIAISENTFTSRTNAMLFVPEGTEDEYRAADYWKEFQNIVSKIEFNDPKVKAICIANWDTNRDGELTKDEAAAVTTLGMAFTGNTEIETFNELKYFTGLKWNNIPALTGGDGNQGAFDGCTNLKYIELPSNIEQIMNFSFRGCTSLSSVNIPSGVSDILDNAFNGCTGLGFIYMPQSLEHIGANAFDGCTSLRWITFPDKVITFGNKAFNGCTSLTSITVNSRTPGTINGDPFPTRGNITLTVPKDAYVTYRTTDYWKDFKFNSGSGDADGSGSVDINDVLAVVDYILGKEVPSTFALAAADVTGDVYITIADATAIVDKLVKAQQALLQQKERLQNQLNECYDYLTDVMDRIEEVTDQETKNNLLNEADKIRTMISDVQDALNAATSQEAIVACMDNISKIENELRKLIDSVYEALALQNNG